MKDWSGDKNSIFKIIAASNHTKSERQNEDFYATDPIVIDKLLTVEKPSNFIFECACGKGHLSERLKEFGYSVHSSDLIDRGYSGATVEDFFSIKEIDQRYDILTNPPYKYAKEFVLHSLNLLADNRKCYMFLKTTFLEGKTRYKDLFSKYPPKVVYVFIERVLCAKNAEFEWIKASGGSAVSYSWFVFEKGYKGETVIKWI